MLLHKLIGGVYLHIGPFIVFTFLGGRIGAWIRRMYVKLRGDIVRFRSRYGFLMEVSPYEHWMSGYLFLGETNPLETAILMKSLRKNDVMIDVGAHNGWYSFVANQCVGEGGRILAFEPNPQCIKAFRNNLRLNGYQNIQLITAALSDKNGFSAFWIGDDMAGSLIKDQTEHVSAMGVAEKKVRTYRLDDYLLRKNTRPVRFIKIDVEGAELEVITGAQKTLQKYAPIILAEVYCKDRKQEQKRKALFAKLKNLGYEPYMITPAGIKKTRYADVARDTINIVLQHSKNNRIE